MPYAPIWTKYSQERKFSSDSVSIRTEFLVRDVGKSILILLELSLGLMVETSVSKYSNETAPRANANNIIPEIMFFDIRGLLSFLDLNTVFFLVIFYY